MYIRIQRLLTIFIVFLGLISFHQTADAHAYIVKSNPKASQSLAASPSEIQIWFDEAVQTMFGGLTVESENGKKVDLGDAHIDANNPNLLECKVQPNLPAGVYSIHWRVISADGHPVEGVIPFSVKTQITGSTKPTTVNYTPGWDMLAIRWLFLLGVVAFLGTFLFVLLVAHRDLRQWMWGKPVAWFAWPAWIVMFVSTLLALPLQTKIDAGVSWSEAFRPSAIAKVLLYSSFGKPWLTQLLTLFILMILLKFVLDHPQRARVGAWVLMAGAGIVLVARSVTSHAADTAFPTLSIAFDAIHICGASLWLGGLLGLLWSWRVCKRHGTEGAQRFIETIRRFGIWAIGSVVILALTGTYAGYQHIPTMYGLFHTVYGRTLLVKLGIVIVMLILGGVQFMAARSGARAKRLVHPRLILVELVLGAAVLMVTSLLTNLPTARANPGPVNIVKVMSAESLKASLKISPNQVGMNQFDVEITDATGRPVTGIQQLTMTLTMEEMDMGSDQFQLKEVRPGVYHAEGMYLTMAGDWDVHLDALLTDFTEATADYQILVGTLQP